MWNFIKHLFWILGDDYMIFLLTVLMWYTTLNNFQMLNQPTSLEQAQLAVYYPLYINYIQRSCLISLLSGSPIGLFPSSVCSLDFFLIWFYFLGCLILFFFFTKFWTLFMKSGSKYYYLLPDWISFSSARHTKYREITLFFCSSWGWVSGFVKAYLFLAFPFS